MAEEQADCVVAGAGIVGLAVARALALAGRAVLVVEAAPAIGTGTSSRNSEVVHGGIYYPPGSLKAVLCVAGRRALYAYCRARGIPHARPGKLIVAQDAAEEAELERLLERGRANGVEGLEMLSAGEVRALEPAVRCRSALLSAESGIVDSHALMLALAGEAEAAGASIVLRAAVEGGEVTRRGLRLRVASGGEVVDLRARALVNAAGLDAQRVAGAIDGLDPRFVPPLHLAKGSYFGYGGRSPFRRLIYPVPEPGGLGVHATLDLAGRVRFGPDVEWVEAIDYDVDPGRAGRFYEVIRRYWPGLPDGSLRPDYAGIRPKLSGPGAPAADFVIQDEAVHGVAGLVNLFGIESPGLTSALAIADRVAAAVAEA